MGGGIQGAFALVDGRPDLVRSDRAGSQTGLVPVDEHGIVALFGG